MSAPLTRRQTHYANGVTVDVRRGGRFVYAFVTYRGLSRSFRYAGGRFDAVAVKAVREFFGGNKCR